MSRPARYAVCDLAERLQHRFADGSATTKPDPVTSVQATHKLTPIIKDAMALKCEILGHRDLYEFTWFRAGDPFDDETMVARPGEAKRGDTVVATLSPGLYRAEVNGSKTVIARAQVTLGCRRAVSVA